MKRIVITAGILSTLSLSAFAQDTSIPKFNSDIEVTAVVDAGCFLTAQNLNFGVIQMPISSQSTTAPINLKCSKNVNLKIGIAYDNNINLSSSTITYSIHPTVDKDAQWIFLYENGKRLTSLRQDASCRSNSPGKILVWSEQAAKILGYTGDYNSLEKYNLSTPMLVDTNNYCSGNRFNIANLEKDIGLYGGVKENGSLMGLIKGENILYSLELPGNSSKKWSISNTYAMISNGDDQQIQMKANITSSGNPTHRLSPDTYQDTLTVVLTY